VFRHEKNHIFVMEILDTMFQGYCNILWITVAFKLLFQKHEYKRKVDIKKHSKWNKNTDKQNFMKSKKTCHKFPTTTSNNLISVLSYFPTYLKPEHNHSCSIPKIDL